MRILIAIPHFYRPEPNSIYGSLEATPQNRIHALTQMLHHLYQHFHSPHGLINIADKTIIPANHAEHTQLDIVICTDGINHLLDKLPVPSQWYTHRVFKEIEPRLLGFSCHEVLRDAVDKGYDYYCFMEDDLVIHDSSLFYKLSWFSQQAGEKALLQPHLYEVSTRGPFYKGYLNGEINPNAAAKFQDIRKNHELTGSVMGRKITFRRTTNPHSGCFFLQRNQLLHWISQPYFLDRDISFVDPMASAATLGITKTFEVYKPGAENASFLEIEHIHRRYWHLLGSTISINNDLFEKLGYRFAPAATSLDKKEV